MTGVSWVALVLCAGVVLFFQVTGQHDVLTYACALIGLTNGLLLLFYFPRREVAR